MKQVLRIIDYRNEASFLSNGKFCKKLNSQIVIHVLKCGNVVV